MRRLAFRLLCAAALAVPHPALAQQATMLSVPGGAERMQIELPLNTQRVVTLPREARRVMIGNPAIADGILHTPRQVSLIGMGVGDTTVHFLDAADNEILILQVRVDRDVTSVNDMLRRFVPQANISAQAIGNDIVLDGVAPSSAAADRARQIAERYVDGPENILSLVSVDGTEQVQLQIRVVEIQRTALKQIGVNWNSAYNYGNFDDAELANIPNRVDEFGNPVFEALEQGRFDNGFTFGTSNGFGVNGGNAGGLAIGGGIANFVPGTATIDGADVLQSQLGVNLNALERSGLVRTLQEPNLTTVSGTTANFHAGGEFPAPAGVDDEGNVAYEFREFGVNLNFTPVVLSNNRISIQISTSVSDLSNVGALTIPGEVIRNAQGQATGQTQGTTIPGLSIRSAEATVELSSGGSIVIGGLINDETRQSIDGLPGVRDLPVLGALFRSNDFLSEQSELVIIATAYLVDQTSRDQLQTPIDGLRVADGPEATLLGRLNRVYALPGADAGGRTWRGPYGFITEPGNTP